MKPTLQLHIGRLVVDGAATAADVHAAVDAAIASALSQTSSPQHATPARTAQGWSGPVASAVTQAMTTALPRGALASRTRRP
jgi:hypothetical protein